MTDTLRYDRRTVLFHWITLGMIAANWGLAQIVDVFGRENAVWPRSAHILIGFALILLIIARLLWRNVAGSKLPPADTGALGLAAKAAHWGLYALVIAVLGFGLAYEAMRGDDILALGHLPVLITGERALRSALRGYHELATNLLLILAGVHATAALAHRYLWKDSVLQRMTIG